MRHLKILNKTYKIDVKPEEAVKLLMYARIARPRELHENRPGARVMFFLERDLKKMMSRSELRAFKVWMYGQTCAMITSAECKEVKKPEAGYYTCDVSRFYTILYGGTVSWD